MSSNAQRNVSAWAFGRSLESIAHATRRLTRERSGLKKTLVKFLRISLPTFLLLACLSGVAVTTFTREPADPPHSPEVSADVAAERFEETAREDSVSRATPPGSPALAPIAALDQLAARMDTRSAGLKIVTHPDGRRSVDLRGRFAHTTAMVRGPDGRMVVQCFSNAQVMAAALAGTEKPQPPLAADR